MIREGQAGELRRQASANKRTVIDTLRQGMGRDAIEQGLQQAADIERAEEVNKIVRSGKPDGYGLDVIQNLLAFIARRLP